MKKILFFSALIIFIPVIIVNIFIRDDEIKFKYAKNIQIRVKRSNNEIDNIPFEDYIVGVLAGEMPLSFHTDALKAQAVAARTYALKKMMNNINNDYDVVDTVSNQVYLDNNYLKDVWKEDYVKNVNILKEVVYQTCGEYIEYKGEVIEALFFSTSSGKTNSSEDVFGHSLPYLVSVDSSWDNISPVYEDKIYYELNDLLNKLNLSISKDLEIKIIEKTDNGMIKKVIINNKEFTGKDVASVLGLRSTNFNITYNGDAVIITTKGYGHGVGMSQYGAEAMSILGYNYKDILKYYYKGVEIVKKQV